MSRATVSALWRLARATLFYPAVFALMLWLTLTGQQWGWGIAVITAVVVLDPIYRIILTSILSWRPAKK